MKIVREILTEIEGVSQPQKKFLVTLFTTILLMRGKVNFRNMSRYSNLCEKTYSRKYQEGFDFPEFNRILIEKGGMPEDEVIVATDSSYLKKSGKKTYGLDTFYDSIHNQPAKGLEVSNIAIINLSQNRAYTLSSRQTPPLTELQNDPTIKARKKGSISDEAKGTRMDFYLKHLQEDKKYIPENVNYFVGDGHYANQKFVDGVRSCNLHFVGKLRSDAQLKYLYEGKQKGKGAPRKYGENVQKDMGRLDYVGQVDDNIYLCTAVVKSISLKRNIRLVLVINMKHPESPRYVFLFSTDTELEAEKVYHYYKARFQIEFIFRDTKQFTGLSDCQARSKERIHFHINASFSALNVAKIEAQKFGSSESFSMASLKAVYFNEHLLSRFISMLDLDLTSIKIYPHFKKLRTYGSITA